MRIAIVDDDPSICKIISNIIDQYSLGTVVGVCGDGVAAESLLDECRPDIAIIDLLLPGQDGIALIKKQHAKLVDTSFVMISENRAQPLITEAYEQGCEFYIHKPVNVLEVISIIGRVKETRRMKAALSAISQTTAQFRREKSERHQTGNETDKNKIFRILLELGIVGEGGVKTIHQMAELIREALGKSGAAEYQLRDIYLQASLGGKQDVKTLEQRVRRTIAKAQNNVAHLGIDDYGNDKFQRYSSSLFDFGEVRQEMNCILGKTPFHGKINVKKFIEGLVFLAATDDN